MSSGAQRIWGNETSLCDTVRVDPHHYTCAQTHRACNTEGDPEVHCGLWVMTTVPVLDMRTVGVCARGGGGGHRQSLPLYLAANLTLL